MPKKETEGAGGDNLKYRNTNAKENTPALIAGCIPSPDTKAKLIPTMEIRAILTTNRNHQQAHIY
eukprot:m.90129 g.90129  ORF g.90129 m.90129 type:complete len:65 (-) comp12301_c1_seq2:60-254(-)